MSFPELLSAFSDDPGLFWAALGAIGQALEALVVLFSAGFIIFQLRRMRQESIKDRVSGLRTAIEVLDSDLFRKVVREASSGAVIRGVDWDMLLDQLDLIGLLISENYTDEALFLKLKGQELRRIAEYVQNREFADELEKHPGAAGLLEKVRAAVM